MGQTPSRLFAPQQTRRHSRYGRLSYIRSLETRACGPLKRVDLCVLGSLLLSDSLLTQYMQLCSVHRRSAAVPGLK